MNGDRLMEYTSEEKAYIWLDSFALERNEKRRLLSQAGGAAALVRDFPRFGKELIKSGKESVYNTMLESLSDGGKGLKKTLGKLEREGIKAVARVSADYPDALKNRADAPPVLYARGNTALLKTRMFAVVGSRRTHAAALRLGAEICRELSGAFTVLTGTAEGGDSAAITGALKGSGNVVSVAAGGFSSLPQGNAALLSKAAERGLLLSAHTFSAPVRNFSYESRNALLAALCEGVLVLGAGKDSGALITARYAGREGKKIFALPYAPGAAAGAGCNALIKKGAYLTENSVDISGAFGINLIEEKSIPALSDDEAAALNALKELSEAHVCELSAKTGMPPFKLYAVLSALEVKGLAVRLGGNRYAPVK